MAVEFSTEVRLGDLLTIGAFIGVGITAFFNIRGRLDINDVRMEHLKEKMEEISKDKTGENLKKEHEDTKLIVERLVSQMAWVRFKLGANPDGEYDHLGKREGVGP